MWWPDGRSTRERRLQAELPSFKLHLENAMKTRGAGPWSESAQAALAQANEALRLKNFAEALIAFDRAQREEIPSLSEEEVILRAISLLHQSEQLNPATRDAITEILKTPSNSEASKKHQITTMELSIATKLRDEDLETTFFDMERLNRHLWRLCLITFAVLVLVVSVVFHAVRDEPAVLVGVVFFGALGAAASTMMSIMPPIDGAIPSQLKTGLLMFARPLFGATAAVAIYMFLKMHVLNVIAADAGNSTYFGLAFVAGFSDRLLLSAVSKVAASYTESAKGKESKAR